MRSAIPHPPHPGSVLMLGSLTLALVETLLPTLYPFPTMSQECSHYSFHSLQIVYLIIKKKHTCT